MGFYEQIENSGVPIAGGQGLEILAQGQQSLEGFQNLRNQLSGEHQIPRLQLD